MVITAIGMAIKGALILALALLAATMLKRRSAGTRYMVWSAALVSLLLLPVLSGLTPTWRTSLLPAVPASWAYPAGTTPAEPRRRPARLQPLLPTPVPRAPMVLPDDTLPEAVAPFEEDERSPAPASESGAQAPPSLQGQSPFDSALPAWPALLVGIYFTGVVLMLAHLLLGAARVVWMIRQARPVGFGPLRQEFDRAVNDLGIAKPVTLFEGNGAVPVAWELRSAAVVLPRGASAWPRERQRVVLLHELVHVLRRDCQMQLLAHVTLALYWFNPMAWLAVRRLRSEREHACDDLVLSLGTRASDYAEHLLHVARGLVRGGKPAWASVAMARSSHLEGRVAAILDPDSSRRLPDRRTMMIASVTTLALLLPLAALQGAQTQETSTQVEQHLTASYVTMPHLPGYELSAPAQESGVEPTIDELVQMRIHGVTPAFVEEVVDAVGRQVSVQEVVQMRIHGTTPEFIAGLSRLFPSAELTTGNITQMRIHGATIDYIEAMQGAFGGAVTMSDITQMRIHGASTEFVSTMRELLPDETLDVGDITQMRIHGVTLKLVRDLQADGYNNLSAQDLVQMRIHGFDRWLKRRGGR